MFGIVDVLVDVQHPDGVRLAVGYAPSRGNLEYVDLMLAGAVQDGGWRVRILEAMPSSYDERGCSAEIAAELIPGGASIVAQCLTGGTDRVGYVAVLGVEPETSLPNVMLVLSCGVTWAEVNGPVLRIRSSGPKAAAHLPGAPQPDIEFEWDGFGLDTRDVKDFGALRTYCDERGPEFGYGQP
jgi:hypothetical protein